MKNNRVVVAMSGGVDSSVAAYLLQKQGYEVIGITMCFGLSDGLRRKPVCCGISAIEDAKKVAQQLNIKHYVLNFNKILEEKVIKNFCDEYLSGRTPNPCVRCNRYLKFGQLLKKAKSLGARYLATGHYARIYFDKKTKISQLKKAKDLKKDQSYFLFYLTESKLKDILMPLGKYTKEQVRQIAKKENLAVADKPGSQEICFLPTKNYQEFLKNRFPQRIKPGNIVDEQGRVLARHKGICFYTIGQRQGLGISWHKPLYVTRIDPERNLVVVGSQEDTLVNTLIAKEINFISDRDDIFKKDIVLKAKIRYNHKEVPCKLKKLDTQTIQVNFLENVYAVTPGQAVVIYDDDIVLGGGIIEKI